MTDSADAPSVRIAAELRRRIAGGELRPGDRMPSTRALVQRHGVAMATATKVLTTLRREGLIISVPGVGSVVAAPPPAVPSHTPRARTAVDAGLGADSIVAAGVAIADAEGLPAVTMRRIATELAAAPMSLYRHVADKEQLLHLMMDAAIAECTLPNPPPTRWREGLELAARSMWATFRAHPWLPGALSLTRPQLLPGALAYSNWVLGVLGSARLDPLTTFTVHLTVFTFVRGTAMNLELETEAEASSGQTSDEWMAGHENALQRLVSDGRHENFARVLAGMDFDLDLDALFDFGLQRLLDGIAALTAT